MRASVVALIVAPVLVPIGVAHAGPPTGSERALAEQLFQDGKKLMGDGKFDQACPKLEESQRLDPGGGTILNLAACHEAQGRTASAWSEFREALGLARTEGRHDRETAALERIAKLEARLSHLTVVIDKISDTPGLTVKVDGESLSRVAWGGPVPIDPGPHALVATAPGKMEWDFTVQIGASQDKAVSVPVLADAPPASTPTSTAMSVAGASTEPTPSGSSGMTSSERPSRPADRTKRNVGFAVGGVGIVALGVGAFFGVAAISKRKASNDFCSGSTCTDQRGIDDNNNAKRFATFADIGLGVGVAGIAAGVYLLMTSRGTTPASASPPVSARLRVMPEFGRQGGSLVLSGAW